MRFKVPFSTRIMLHAALKKFCQEICECILMHFGDTLELWISAVIVIPALLRKIKCVFVPYFSPEFCALGSMQIMFNL